MSGPRRKDLTGQVFGRLVVISFAGVAKSGDALWNCKCSCGNDFIAKAAHLKGKDTSSCGCLKREMHTKHNGCNRPEYAVWEGMIQRCTNPKATHYADYGGRGIEVCERWRDFANFIKDMGERPGTTFSIDRIDGNGNYEPENCRWATKSEQVHHLRIFKTNTSGAVGVFHDKKCNTYRASISVNNKTRSLGSFKNLSEAIEARRQGEIKYWGGTHENQ